MTNDVKHSEQIPPNIDELVIKARDKSNYNNRLIVVEELGKFKCRQSIDVLWRLMMNDKVYIVQEQAFRKLQAFGEDVKLPRKKKGLVVKDINKKLMKVRNSLKSGFTASEFNAKLQELYPEEFDIYSYEKQDKFDQWVANVLSNLPKQ